MAIKLQIRRGLAADWADPSNNPVLLLGELGLETDTGNFKIGDGTTAWNSLAYARVTYPQINGAGNDIDVSAYRAQGRYEIGVSVATNVPADWTPASDAPGILLVTRIATGSIAQVLFSTKTQKVFCRAWDGTTYTAWVSLATVGTTQIVDLAVTTPKIADNAVTNAKLRDSAALSVVGNSANATGDPLDILCAAGTGFALRESGNTLGFGLLTTNAIGDDAVTYAKLQNVSTGDRVLGRISGSGNVEEITCTATGRSLISQASASAFRTSFDLPQFSTMTAYAGIGSVVIAASTANIVTTLPALNSVITQPSTPNAAAMKLILATSGTVVSFGNSSSLTGTIVGGAGAQWRVLGTFQYGETPTGNIELYLGLFVRIA